MSPGTERTGPRQEAGPVITATDTVPQTADETAQRLAERVAQVRRTREYRQQVRVVLERNRAAGKALRHARRLAESEPVGHLDPSEVE